MRRRWFKHPWKTLPSSVKGIADGQEVARRYRDRLEAYRASRGEPRLGVSNQSDETVVKVDHTNIDQPSAVTDKSGNRQAERANRRRPEPNGKDIDKGYVRETDQTTGDSIVVVSSEHDESESSLSPVPSAYDGDEADSSYSSRPTTSHVRNASADPTRVWEEFDMGDCNDPPTSPGNTSQSGADSRKGGHGNDGPYMVISR